MKTLFSTVVIALLAIGFLLAASPGKAEAWHRSSVSLSVVVPPFGFAVGDPYYSYYPGPVYVAPPYPVYGRAYYWPYYGPYYRYRYWGHRGWRGDWHGDGHGRWHERGDRRY